MRDNKSVKPCLGDYVTVNGFIIPKDTFPLEYQRILDCYDYCVNSTDGNRHYNSKPVYLYDSITLAYLKEFPNIKIASKVLNILPNNLSVKISDKKVVHKRYVLSFTKADKYPETIAVRDPDYYVHQYDLDGNYIKSFRNVLEVTNETGIWDYKIRLCLKTNKVSPNLDYIFSKQKVDKLDISKFNIVRHKKIYQYDKQGNFIKEYENVNQACKETKIDYNSIMNNCKHLSKSTKGFVFTYEKR